MSNFSLVLSLFIHNISLNDSRCDTTASNLFHESLLRRAVGEFHLSFEHNYGLLVIINIE